MGPFFIPLPPCLFRHPSDYPPPRSMVGGSFHLRSCRWFASGRWVVFPSYSRHVSPSRLWRSPILPNCLGAKDGTIKPDIAPLRDVSAMSPCHITLPRHPATSPCHVTLPRHAPHWVPLLTSC